MQILDVIQRSPEWLEARKGMLTSCRIAAACSFNKNGKESGKRAKMKLELLQELITGRAVEHYVSPAMEFGIEFEAQARAEYELRQKVSVDLIGFLLHPTLDRCGASPDGLIDGEGLLEIKVPNTITHLEYLRDGVVPSEYIPQITWQLACAGPEAKYCDFTSFDPRLPEDLQMLIVRVDRDEKKIAEQEKQAIIFLEEVVAEFEQIKRNAKNYSLEDKLRASVRQARGQYPEFDAELQITEQDCV